jgi:hypothetical protein
MRPVAALALLLTSCADDLPYEGAFDLPIAAAVLDVERGPFREPIGYVASGHTGQIALLALKQGRFLTDDRFASFFRGAPLAAGGARRLTSIVTWAPTTENIRVFAGDAAFGQLLEIPHIVGFADGEPVEADTAHTVPQFEDVDGSGSRATLKDFDISPGFTTTEDWTITYDGEEWWVEGTRSGPQEKPARFDELYISGQHRIAFTVEGDATAGDRFTVRTESGLREFDVGGVPLALSMDPAHAQLAMIVHDRVENQPVLRWFDPVTSTMVEGPGLPDDARPLRLTRTREGTLYVADGQALEDGTGILWEITTDGAVAHALPMPAADAAVLNTASGRVAFIAPLGSSALWKVNLETGEPVDFNAWIPGVQPLPFESPIGGIEAIPVRHRLPERDEDGVQRWEQSVAVSLAAGQVVFAEAETGCLVRTEQGPNTSAVSSSNGPDYSTNFQAAHPEGPTLEASPHDNRHVQVNPCTGIARNETWTLRFDRNRQLWQVEGSIAGLQQAFARENERYISDDGAVSFLIRSGSEPTGDGWSIDFRVDDGVLAANGDNDRDGNNDVRFDFPGDPLFFSYRVGPTNNGWDPIDERPFVLVTAASSDVVSRVEPSTGELEVNWR